MNWETSTCIKDIQTFIGFVNFYQRFVQGFSKVVASLIALVRKDVLFKWVEECQKFFKLLKKRFTTAFILVHFDSTKEIIVKTDAITIATLSSFDRYVSWLQKAQLQVRWLVSYSTIYTVRVHVRVISTNSRTVTSLSH